MKLTVKERLLLPTLFPQASNIATQMLVKDCGNKVQIGEDEKKEIGFKVKDNNLVWDDDKAGLTDIDFSESEMNFLKEQVTRLDKAEKITSDNLDLCLKIRDFKLKADTKSDSADS